MREFALRVRPRCVPDSNLIDVSSRLPEPFAKAQGAALPLHIEVQASADAGQLRGEPRRAAACVAGAQSQR